MNYLAHAFRFLDDPYFVAGTSFPDWMNVLDRKNRARRQYAQQVEDDSDPQIAAFARGCIQHHDDDHWFHQSAEFTQLSTQFSVELRDILNSGLGHQAGFLGHISVELLLDAVIEERQPGTLELYYELLRSVDPQKAAQAANKICSKPVYHLERLLPRFIAERFLSDYQDDALLLKRLNQVMNRVRLPQLPTEVIDWLGSARPRVRLASQALLSPNQP